MSKATIYCNNCKKDVTKECIMDMDSSELPYGKVWVRSCPYCHKMDFKWS